MKIHQNLNMNKNYFMNHISSSKINQMKIKGILKIMNYLGKIIIQKVKVKAEVQVKVLKNK